MTEIPQEIEIIRIIIGAIALVVVMALAIVLFFYFSRKKITQAELDKANLEVSYQKELVQSILLTQEEERKRIAQDLHDAISSKLNIVSLNANILTEEHLTNEERKKIASGIVNVTGTVLESSRKIAHDLLPPTFEKFGLKAAIEELCEEVSETQKFNIRCNLHYKPESLSKDKELHVFRITQELCNNALKYSNASFVKIDLRSTENTVSLQYRDDGVGFDLVSAKEKKGLGISGIENRVALLQGSFAVESAKNEGVQALIEIPI
ncbi:sensor histidine kinase [Jejudonia soesokkakensis]|uniref:histidine kinase n=1 Tax=Jejudonia soesokkakensis TaxID=1323432 RepID=A0ABW2MUW0_9FLAO